jgi:hypothetical protein
VLCSKDCPLFSVLEFMVAQFSVIIANKTAGKHPHQIGVGGEYFLGRDPSPLPPFRIGSSFDPKLVKTSVNVWTLKWVCPHTFCEMPK